MRYRRALSRRVRTVEAPAIDLWRASPAIRSAWGGYGPEGPSPAGWGRGRVDRERRSAQSPPRPNHFERLASQVNGPAEMFRPVDAVRGPRVGRALARFFRASRGVAPLLLPWRGALRSCAACADRQACGYAHPEDRVTGRQKLPRTERATGHGSRPTCSLVSHPITPSRSRDACDTSDAQSKPNVSLDVRMSKAPSRAVGPSYAPSSAASTDADIASAARHASASPPRPGESSGASSNAARTTERDIEKGPYAAAGPTHDGKSTFAAAALLKGSTPSGIEGEVASASIQVGRRNEAQAAVVRRGVQGSRGSVSGEAFTVAAHLGADNPDSSVGLHAGATATLGARRPRSRRPAGASPAA